MSWTAAPPRVRLRQSADPTYLIMFRSLRDSLDCKNVTRKIVDILPGVPGWPVISAVDDPSVSQSRRRPLLGAFRPSGFSFKTLCYIGIDLMVSRRKIGLPAQKS